MDFQCRLGPPRELCRECRKIREYPGCDGLCRACHGARKRQSSG